MAPRATERAALLAFAVLGALLGPKAARAQELGAPSAASAVYVRTDTDDTTVVTPRLRVGANLAEETRVDLVYTVDVWTSASIDIRTSATKRVTEQRDEIDVSLEHAFPDVTVGGSYRYSTEYDYVSNGGSLGAGYDFADNNANIALTARAYFDQVGRAGDPGFDHDASTLAARAAFTQVIDPQMFAVLVYELSRQQGYLSSPYRYVRIADDEGVVPSTCAGVVRMCVLERNPDTRVRHAIALSARRALSNSFSIGANYRFYLDSWDMTSNTAGVDAGFVPSQDWLFSLGYRFYTQSAASHYEPFYPAMPLPEHYTSDKELTALTSHRLELEISRAFELDTVGSLLRTVLIAAPSHFLYHDYPLVDHISALELTLAVEVNL